MVQPAENRCRHDAMTRGQLMPAGLRSLGARWRFRKTGPQARKRAAPVVMGNPFLKHSPKMPFTEWEQPIQALSANCADQPFAMSVRLRCPHRRLENRQTHGCHHGIDALGIDAVAVVNDPSMGLIA